MRLTMTPAQVQPLQSNGRSAEFIKTSVLYARRKLIPRHSFETKMLSIEGHRRRKIPANAMRMPVA